MFQRVPPSSLRLSPAFKPSAIDPDCLPDPPLELQKLVPKILATVGWRLPSCIVSRPFSVSAQCAVTNIHPGYLPGLRSRPAVRPLHGFVRHIARGHIPDRHAHGLHLSELFPSSKPACRSRRLPLLPLPDFLSTDSRSRVPCVTATHSTLAVPRRFSVFPCSWPFPVLQPETSSNLGPAPEGSSCGKSFTRFSACFSRQPSTGSPRFPLSEAFSPDRIDRRFPESFPPAVIRSATPRYYC